MSDRLFIGTYPEGFVYADRTVDRHGDYKRLAFLSFNTLKLDIERDCPPDLERRIRDDASQYSVGQTIQVSSSGQTRKLGLGLTRRNA